MWPPPLLDPKRARAILGCAALGIALLVGCAPEIGDDCETSLDCSSNNTRICDRTQPHGYCTIMDCEKGTCPEDSVCVKFMPLEERLSVTYCMAECEDDDDCRSDEGYLCTKSTEFGADTEIAALVLDGENKAFCSIPEVQLPEPDAGMGVPDGGPMMSIDDAGSDDAGSTR